DPLLHRGAEVLGDGAAEDLVLPDEALAARRGRDLDDADPVLAVAAGLLDVPALGARRAMDGLAVGHARHRRRRLDAVLTLQLLERHVEVDVAEAGDDQLLGLLDALDVKRRVLLAQAGEPG